MLPDDEYERATVTPELLELIRRRYGFVALAAEVDLGGAYNLNMLVAADGEEFVVRVYNTYVRPERLAAIQHVRDHLRNRSWPVASVQLTTTGEGFCSLGPRLIELERFVQSDGQMNSWPRLVVGLSTLGRLHTDLRECPAPAAAREPPLSNHVAADRVVEETAPAIASIRGLGLTRDQARCVDAAEQLASALLHASERLPFDLPAQLVHGDFWDNNVRFRGQRVVLIGDFDFMGFRARIDDLALTLFFANDSLGREDMSATRLAQLRDLVDNYDQALTPPLNAEERAALPYAIARSPLCFVRDIAYQGRAALGELTRLRGPEWEWALCVIESPDWLGAFQ